MRTTVWHPRSSLQLVGMRVPKPLAPHPPAALRRSPTQSEAQSVDDEFALAFALLADAAARKQVQENATKPLSFSAAAIPLADTLPTTMFPSGVGATGVSPPKVRRAAVLRRERARASVGC